MIDPALHAGLEVSYYRVDRNLGIDVEDALAHAGEDVCAFVFVNFFGFPADIDKIAPELRRRGIAIIEDSSHSFLAWQPYGLAGGRGDYTVYSFAKLVPCGVGGGLRAHGQPFEAPALLRSAPKDSVVRSKRLLEQAILSADERSSLRRAYVALEVARVERKRAKSAGQGTGGTRAVEPAQGGACSFGNLAFEPFHARTRIPWLPHRILKGADLRDIAARRRRNYSLYAEQLAHLVAPPSVLPELGDSVCPWAYPILVADRAQHDVRLRSLGVPVWTFGDLLHPNVEAFASPAAATDARFLSTHLLCLPVHQGLQPDTIAGFARIVADANLPRVST
jgi:hypothetical protein